MIAIFIAVIIDQLSKIWALFQLKPMESYEFVPGILHLTYAENTGAAFSMLAGSKVFLIIFPLIICAVLVYILVSKKISNKIGNWSIVLILGGAIGNLIDRIFRGAVIDFFEIRLFKFAIFNVADIYYCWCNSTFYMYFVFCR